MNLQTPPGLDLTACDREPIHIPGSIQPHGILLAIRLSDEIMTYASANAAAILGLDSASVLGRPFREVLPDLVQGFEAELTATLPAGSARYIRTLEVATAIGPQFYDAVISRSGDHAVLELEEASSGAAAGFDALSPVLRAFVNRLHKAETIGSLCHLAAEDIRSLTGFDRVLVYRFDENWNGTVIAEDRNDNLPSYLDLRFPASDIPAQARELYRRNRLRIIPDAGYTPVPIESHDPAPLDLSDSVLRSVSPVHTCTTWARSPPCRSRSCATAGSGG